jgi:hypothetical protein
MLTAVFVHLYDNLVQAVSKEISDIVRVLLFVGTIFVISTKCIYPWILEFVVSNITCNKQWENCF